MKKNTLVVILLCFTLITTAQIDRSTAFVSNLEMQKGTNWNGLNYGISDIDGYQDNVQLAEQETDDSVQITFMVDMQNESISSEGIFVGGDWNSWYAWVDPIPMTANDNIYSATIKLPKNLELTYKFKNGEVWEDVDGTCAVGENNDRTFTTSSVDETLATVCFNSCEQCVPITDSVTVRFYVDMQNEEISETGVHINGSFSDWYEAIAMEAYEDIYQADIKLPIGDTVEYKFINGGRNDWDKYEIIDGDCAYGDDKNRYLVVPDKNSSLSTLCFGSCEACIADTISITFNINMQNETVAESGVFMFGRWDDYATPLQLTNTQSEIYSVTVKYPAKNEIDYQYFNGNPNGEAGTFEAEDFTGECMPNEWSIRGFTTTKQDTILPIMCFNSCDNCLTDSDSINITFQVDMQNESISSEGIFVGGDWNSWYAWVDPIPMTANDNIYSATIKLPKNLELTYKFKNGEVWEDVDGTCAVGENNDRTFTTSSVDETLATVCFNSCEQCVPITDSVTVRFYVDMQNEEISETGVHINGSFSDWYEAIAMEAYEDIYQADIKLPIGDTVEYKFINGGRNDWDKYEIIDGDCAYGDDKNRYLVVPDKNSSLSTLCFGSCEACIADTISITFNINMQNETVAESGVFMFGRWDDYATPLQLTNTQSEIYSVTVKYPAKNEIDYQYFNGNPNGEAGTFEAEDFTGECMPNEWSIRGFTTTKQDTILPIMCFNSCDNCLTNSIINPDENKIHIYPNPIIDNVMVEGLNNRNCTISIYNTVGNLFDKIQTNYNNTIEIKMDSYKAGTYIIKIEDVATQELIDVQIIIK
jgi:hypothetical protein